MKSFDEILKKAKDRVKDQGGEKKKWRECINNAMAALHELNDLYPDEDHNVEVRATECDNCLKPSFLLVVKNINNLDRKIKVHKAGWAMVKSSTYKCEKCKD